MFYFFSNYGFIFLNYIFLDQILYYALIYVIFLCANIDLLIMTISNKLCKHWCPFQRNSTSLILLICFFHCLSLSLSRSLCIGLSVCTSLPPSISHHSPHTHTLQAIYYDVSLHFTCKNYLRFFRLRRIHVRMEM